MVTNVTSLTGNGLKDWLIQRVTAVYFIGYSLYLFGFLLLHPHMQYGPWLALFDCIYFQIASAMVLFAFLLHSWVGLWTVTTDYLNKCTMLRITIQMLVLLALLSQFIWGLMIVWGHV